MGVGFRLRCRGVCLDRDFCKEEMELEFVSLRHGAATPLPKPIVVSNGFAVPRKTLAKKQELSDLSHREKKL
jgi:hypothetical protein